MCDNGFPVRCANTTGTITVTRNQFPPNFINEPYTRSITESTTVGSTIVTLTATDNDLAGSLVYEAITTSYPFLVDRSSGVVTLGFDTLFFGPQVYSVSVLDSKLIIHILALCSFHCKSLAITATFFKRLSL